MTKSRHPHPDHRLLLLVFFGLTLVSGGARTAMANQADGAPAEAGTAAPAAPEGAAGAPEHSHEHGAAPGVEAPGGEAKTCCTPGASCCKPGNDCCKKMKSADAPCCAGHGGGGGASACDSGFGGTDHAQVVRKWGVDVRSIATLNRSGFSPDPRCPAGAPCSINVSAIGVRRWVSNHYAWNAALMLAAGGGKTDAVGYGSWDTHFGFGPLVGANFLLASTKHMAVSAAPQVGFLAFLPSGSGSKTYMLDLRAAIEAEVHLGFVGLPNVSVGTSVGLAFAWTKKTLAGTGKDMAGGVPGALPFSAWDLGVAGAQTPWGLVNNAFLRFYF